MCAAEVNPKMRSERRVRSLLMDMNDVSKDEFSCGLTISKMQLQSELQDPRIACGGDAPEIRGAQVRVRCAEIRVIDDIKPFAAGLQPQPLRNRKLPAERGIHTQRA